MRNSRLTSVLLLLFITLTSKYATAACLQFSGKYVVNSAGCYTLLDGIKYSDNTYSGMDISADDSSNNLSMHYREGGDRGYTVTYIADGNEHDGDYYNSGKTYTASCDVSQIKSTRNGMFIAPFMMTFSQEADGTFTLTETITASRPFTRSCSFAKAP